jgi:DNA-binding NarL/FixJ family response regulator
MIEKTAPVLIADDDEYFRLALTALLTGPLGFSRVIESASLDEAFDRLANSGETIALALFDLRMPGMESPANLGAVRECYPGLRVAVVSASRRRQDVLSALEIGAHGYIPKSFGPSELVRALQVVISGDIFVPAFLAELPKAEDIGAQDAQRAAVPDRAHGPASGHSRDDVRSNQDTGLPISPRQRQVLNLLVKGQSNKQIANELSLGEGTVKVHVAALLRHLGVSNRAAAAATGALLLRAS